MEWGSKTRDGVGVEKFVPSLESLSSLCFESGMSQEFCRHVPDPLGVFKRFVQKKFVRVLLFPIERRISEEP